MSRIHNVPADVREKEKIVGGLLTIGQFAWVLAGFLLGLASLAGTFLLTKSLWLSIPVGAMFSLTGLPFAFFKKMECIFQHTS
ncbi:MAG: PrgI family protein [Romboutsia sp.]|nr:PrgI family protein [Romboutsia sp.]